MEISSRLRHRSYQGLAGEIRNRVVAGISLTLFSASIAILAGIYFLPLTTLNFFQAFFLGVMLALACTLGGYYLILRLLKHLLRSTENFEKSLTEMTRSKNISMIPDDLNGKKKFNPLTQNYNLLVHQLKEDEARQLDFMDRVSHSLRSPLASIALGSELLLDPRYRPDEAYLDRSYRAFNTQARQACEFIEDATRIYFFEKGHYDLQMAPCKLAQLVETVLDETRGQAEHGFQFNNQAGEVIIPGDELRLRESLIKIITHISNGAAPGVSYPVNLCCSQEPGWVELSFKDIQLGRPEQELLLDEIDWAQKTSGSAYLRNGLRLSIARKIIAFHQGKISVQPGQDGWATLTIHLPVNPC